MNYSNEETERLKKMWPTAKTIKEIMDSFPGRTQAGLGLKARTLGLKAFPRHRRADLSFLISDSIESWYWLGFFLLMGT